VTSITQKTVANQWTPSGSRMKIAKAYLFYNFEKPKASDSESDSTTSPGTSGRKKKKKRSGKKRNQSDSKAKASTSSESLPKEDTDMDLDDSDSYPGLDTKEDAMHVLDAQRLAAKTSRTPADPKTRKSKGHKRSKTQVEETRQDSDPEFTKVT
jgi:hypothetical protein